MDAWSYRQQQPGEQAIFDGAMTGHSLSQARAVLDAFDFKTFSRIIDIGGGQGLLLREILLGQPRRAVRAAASGRVDDIDDNAGIGKSRGSGGR
jgi:hypothetical protein